MHHVAREETDVSSRATFLIILLKDSEPCEVWGNHGSSYYNDIFVFVLQSQKWIYYWEKKKLYCK
ncbi:hypothetical protein Elgi_60160 [Paenibacillus elgii]|nr:hypothetical protein Elgi_60160 [Paenibacillus elgii]